MLRDLVAALVSITEAEGLCRVHRAFLVNGSSFSMPDVPELQGRFGQPGEQKPGCGFPTAKILALFHAGTGMPLKVAVAPPRPHDMAGVGGIHPSLRPGDVLVGDRGFCSFVHIAMLTRDGVLAVFRMHQRQIVDCTPNRPHAQAGVKNVVKGLPRSRWLRGLGALDQVVEWFKPKDHPDWMTEAEFAAVPATLIVRCHDAPGRRRLSLGGAGGTLGARWRVELNPRHLKVTMKMDVLKCKSVDGVLKELTVYAIVYNLVRLVMVEAARRQGVDVERISFIDALRWLAEAAPETSGPNWSSTPIAPDAANPACGSAAPNKTRS